MENSVVVSDYAAMDRILREERKYILNQCKKIKKWGCNVLLIQKSILRDAYNDLSLHFLAKLDIMVRILRKQIIGNFGLLFYLFLLFSLLLLLVLF